MSTPTDMNQSSPPVTDNPDSEMMSVKSLAPGAVPDLPESNHRLSAFEEFLHQNQEGMTSIITELCTEVGRLRNEMENIKSNQISVCSVCHNTLTESAISASVQNTMTTAVAHTIERDESAPELDPTIKRAQSTQEDRSSSAISHIPHSLNPHHQVIIITWVLHPLSHQIKII